LRRRAQIETAIRNLAPAIPDYELHAVADHALDSAGLSTASAETAAWLSMVSFIRHALTEYDALLEEGYDQEAARHFVASDMQAVLTDWGVRRPFNAGD
jgi:hypothetical protein